MTERVSAQELLDYIEDTKRHFATTGEKLNEGAARVLEKLRDRTPGETLRRTYIKTAGGYAMWDVISQRELNERGYKDTGHSSYGLVGSPHVKNDAITYWKSDTERGRDLWVGEPLTD